MDPNLEDMMYDAMRSGDLNGVRQMFQRGVRPSQRQVDYAAAKGYITIIQFLAQQGILPSQYGATAAQELRKNDIVNFLSQYGIHPDPTKRGSIQFMRNVDVQGTPYFDLSINYNYVPQGVPAFVRTQTVTGNEYLRRI